MQKERKCEGERETIKSLTIDSDLRSYPPGKHSSANNACPARNPTDPSTIFRYISPHNCIKLSKLRTSNAEGGGSKGRSRGSSSDDGSDNLHGEIWTLLVWFTRCAKGREMFVVEAAGSSDSRAICKIYSRWSSKYLLTSRKNSSHGWSVSYLN